MEGITMTERKKLADFQLTGTKEEISSTLAVLMFRGCLWETDKKYHSLDEVSKFTYYLKNVTAPISVVGKEKT
jgi:hypothetical protein